MLSHKAQYAFRALTHLVDNYEEGPVLISEIAQKKKIPLKFLENILLQLKKAGILESKKGKGGGYYIKQHPSKTSIASVIRIVDGPIAMLPCVSLYFYRKCENCDERNCGLHGIMESVRDATLSILEKRTLQDLKGGKEDL
ncbi:MAG: Rrf2 family transcriptional regulator, partial [Flavisolibacter sp.]|nr:Rrf2 family transcriptional regulator [Flavisolibacter sp.]